MSSSRRPIDFLWVALAIAGLWFLLPSAMTWAASIPLARPAGAGACWGGLGRCGLSGGYDGPGTVAVGSLIAAVVFCPYRRCLASGSAAEYRQPVARRLTALPTHWKLLLRKLPARTFVA
ncbi:hypothetical protein AB6846_05825 [Serratia proteamaculans]